MRTERDGDLDEGGFGGGDNFGDTLAMRYDTSTLPAPTGHYGFYIHQPSFVEIMRFRPKDTEAARRLAGKDDLTLVNEDGMFVIIRRHPEQPTDLTVRTGPRLSMPG
jgi:hypothetical protein